MQDFSHQQYDRLLWAHWEICQQPPDGLKFVEPNLWDFWVSEIRWNDLTVSHPIFTAQKRSWLYGQQQLWLLWVEVVTKYVFFALSWMWAFANHSATSDQQDYPSEKTIMAMGNPPIEEVFYIENGAIPLLLLMEEILHHLVNNRINYQPQLDSRISEPSTSSTLCYFTRGYHFFGQV